MTVVSADLPPEAIAGQRDARAEHDHARIFELVEAHWDVPLTTLSLRP